MRTLTNEKGSVLIIVIVILMAMTILGSAMLRLSRMELKMVTNDYLHKRSFYAAESGINYAIAELPNVGDFTSPDPNWTVTLNYDLPAKNTNNPNFFEVDIWHKVGIDPSTNMDTVIRWGDADGDYKPEENFTTGYPVEYIYAYGYAGPEARRGHSEIEVQVVRESLVIDPKAALYVGNGLNKNGSAGVADGDYNPMCVGSGVKDVVTTQNAPVGEQATDWPSGCGTFCDFDNNGEDYPVAKIVLRYVEIGTPFTPQNNLVLGDASDNKGIYYYNGDVNMSNLSGYGILVVNGNMTLSGNIDWHGLIITAGDARFDGGGTKQMYGAVIVGGNALGNGTPDFLYDCEVLSDLENEYLRYRKRYWTQR